MSPTSISPANMIVQIIGRTAPSYVFAWKIVNDPKVKLLPGLDIQTFSILLYDI